jgi:hypothetical protein
MKPPKRRQAGKKITGMHKSGDSLAGRFAFRQFYLPAALSCLRLLAARARHKHLTVKYSSPVRAEIKGFRRFFV